MELTYGRRPTWVCYGIGLWSSPAPADEWSLSFFSQCSSYKWQSLFFLKIKNLWSFPAFSPTSQSKPTSLENGIYLLYIKRILSYLTCISEVMVKGFNLSVSRFNPLDSQFFFFLAFVKRRN